MDNINSRRHYFDWMRVPSETAAYVCMHMQYCKMIKGEKVGINKLSSASQLIKVNKIMYEKTQFDSLLFVCLKNLI